MNEQLKDNVSYRVTAFDADGKILNQTFNSGFSSVKDCFDAVKSRQYTIRELHVSSFEGFYTCVYFDANEKEI